MGSPATFGKHAEHRGFEIKLTADKKNMLVKFSEDHGQFAFDPFAGWPSGNGSLGEDDENESEVTSE